MALLNLFRSVRGPLVPRRRRREPRGRAGLRLTPEARARAAGLDGVRRRDLLRDGRRAARRTARRSPAEVEPEFVAKAAVHARRRGRMKDAPAVLLASLSHAGARRSSPRRFPPSSTTGGCSARSSRSSARVRSAASRSGASRSASSALARGAHRRRRVPRLGRRRRRRSPTSSGWSTRSPRRRPGRPSTPGSSAAPHDAAALPEVVRAFEAWKADPAPRRSPTSRSSCSPRARSTRAAWASDRPPRLLADASA